MSFRLFGVDVRVQLGFWIMSFLLGMPLLQSPGLPRSAILIWMLIVLVSVLVHEFGHAMAVKRHKIEPAIDLHWMGGTTSWRELLPIGRKDHIIISLAGPFAGFAFAALIYGLAYGLSVANVALPATGSFMIRQLLWVNFFWGLINLIPVLPFDGGHVLEQALGPKRARLTAIISLIAASAVVIFCLSRHMYWAAMIFGMGGLQSFRRLQSGRVAPAEPARPREPAIDSDVLRALHSAHEALDEGALDRAIGIARGVLAGEIEGRDPSEGIPPRAAVEALCIIGWAHLRGDDLDRAREALKAAERIGPVDPALAGSLLLRTGKTSQARKILEEARAGGDHRKETVGPLIQILIGEGEIARAAAITFDIVEWLSEDDIRHMASVAFDSGVFDWSARLYEASFKRDHDPEDAYAAARAWARDAQPQRAIELLKSAIGAGFSDRARLLSDAAFGQLGVEHGLERLFQNP